MNSHPKPQQSSASTTAWSLYYTPYADLLEALPDEEWKLSELIHVGPDLALYLSAEDPSELVAFYIESFATRFAASDQESLRLLLGEEMLAQLHAYLTEEIMPFVADLKPVHELTGENFIEAVTFEPDSLEFTARTEPTDLMRAARMIALGEFEQRLADSERLQLPIEVAAAAVVVVPIDVRLREGVRAAVESARELLWELQRRPLAAAGAQAGQVEPGVVADHFEDVALGFVVKVDVEGDFLIAYGSLPVETAVTLNLELALTEIGVSLLEDPPETPSLLGSGMTRESGQFRIPLGRVTGPPPPHEPLVASLRLTVEPSPEEVR